MSAIVPTDGLAHAFEPTAASSWFLFEFVGSGVAVTTADGTVEFCNTALLQLMAQSSKTPFCAEWIGLTVSM
jgi:hypothetical protein